MTRIDEPRRYDRYTDPESNGLSAAGDCVEIDGGAIIAASGAVLQ